MSFYNRFSVNKSIWQSYKQKVCETASQFTIELCSSFYFASINIFTTLSYGVKLETVIRAWYKIGCRKTWRRFYFFRSKVVKRLIIRLDTQIIHLQVVVKLKNCTQYN